MFARAGLYFRTARHIPLSQLFYFVTRRWQPLSLWRPLTKPQSLSCSPAPLALRCAFAPAETCIQQKHFHFLAVASPFTTDRIDWKSASQAKLWRYHLHYFDWLRQPDLDSDHCAAMISDWIQRNPAASGDGWEPYPVSLRLVNWIRFFNDRLRAGDVLSTSWMQSLMQQGEWLHRNLEHHIRANHLLKNLVAMLWFCVFMHNQPRYKGWLKRYCDLLQRELREQFNADGGHYERSPMYHAIALEDCIGLVDILQAGAVQHPVVDTLQNRIPPALDYLEAMSFADGKVALFGDSTLHGSQNWRTLQAGWKQLVCGKDAAAERNILSEEQPAFPRVPRFQHFPQSRFVALATRSYRILISTGGVSPSYQPGHTHCDMGSFELANAAGRLITDSGVSEYAAGDMRRYVRSSLAHNVVSVNGDDQHELWGEFRVGARGYAEELQVISLQQDDALPPAFEVTIRTRSHDASAYVWSNTRRFLLREDSIEIQDQIAFDSADLSNASVEASLHLHPALRVEAIPEGYRLSQESGAGVRLTIQRGCETRLEPTWYCPDFGVVQPAMRVSLRSLVNGNARFQISLALEYVAADTVE